LTGNEEEKGVFWKKRQEGRHLGIEVGENPETKERCTPTENKKRTGRGGKKLWELEKAEMKKRGGFPMNRGDSIVGKRGKKGCGR